jgi:hypothetical protein
MAISCDRYGDVMIGQWPVKYLGIRCKVTVIYSLTMKIETHLIVISKSKTIKTELLGALSYWI